MDARLPDAIGRFKVLSLLGRGAMGVVYKARDPHLDRMIAIKVVRADLLTGPDRDTYLARFHDEARIAALCRHDNIVGVHEFGFAGGEPYLAMDYVDGIPINRAVSRGTRISLPEATHIALQILDALDSMHDAGVTHCDIKPANILLTRAARLKITDFGISRLIDMAPAGAPLMIGTPSYMSPEQCLGDKVDRRSDFFSLGAVLYELLTGERPFQGLAYTDTVFKLINQPHHALSALRPELPTEISTIIDLALAKKPEDRFADSGSFTAALGRVPMEDDKPAVLFARQDGRAFTVFDYASPATVPTHGGQDIETVRWTSPAPGLPAAADCPEAEQDVVSVEKIQDALADADMATEPARERRGRTTGMGPFFAVSCRKTGYWRQRMVHTLLSPFLGYRPQREED
ncbi:serine/threonine protein kinase [Acidisoma cellulosilytica]|uniref:Serine/threonine protein kinase n=1 Tax=Acidisoma cellulosilyticum TaxID=2802395 RepID=A0A963Z1C4_9PROT|nr:serine/threonine-protein kinase [Acidisoma cellulosilyticum]MCB8881038.1 serine/threonine protein kinase [Acidisoma cellulosilyticum]